MSSSSTSAEASVPEWEREALKDTTWKIQKKLEKFTDEEAEAIIVRHGGTMVKDSDETPTHTLGPSDSTYYIIQGDNKKASIFEPGFISYIRSNAIGKRMNYADMNCLHGFTFAVMGKLPWLTLKEAQEIVEESGGIFKKKTRGKKLVVDSKVDFVILGNRAKQAEVEKVRGMGIGIIDEQGLFDVIHDKDGARTKHKKHEAAEPAEPAGKEDQEEYGPENKENEPLQEPEEKGEAAKGKGKKAAGTAKRKLKASETNKEAENPPVKKRELRSNSKKNVGEGTEM